MKLRLVLAVVLILSLFGSFSPVSAQEPTPSTSGSDLLDTPEPMPDHEEQEVSPNASEPQGLPTLNGYLGWMVYSQPDGQKMVWLEAPQGAKDYRCKVVMRNVTLGITQYAYTESREWNPEYVNLTFFLYFQFGTYRWELIGTGDDSGSYCEADYEFGGTIRAYFTINKPVCLGCVFINLPLILKP